MDKLRKGTAATRDFYNRVGWRRQDGTLVDTLLFGWMDSPIRRALEGQRKERLREMVGGPGLRLAELGCGGSPAVFLTDLCATYTAVDFSSTGLSEAAAALKGTNVSFETIEADITDLPFEDNAFDVVYSAHTIYHIDTADGQAAAFQEAMRVVRPGGRAIFVLVNPFPLLFPYRLIRRMLAMTPGLNSVLNRLRAKPPLPLSAHALGMDEAAVREVGRCKDHWTCGAKCSVRPHEARTHGMASRPVAGNASRRPCHAAWLLCPHCGQQIEVC